jgi:hypothetical protein
MSHKTDIEAIHLNLVNGNRQDMVKQIKKYGNYDFWSDYAEYLKELYAQNADQYEYFKDATVSYFRITAR